MNVLLNLKKASLFLGLSALALFGLATSANAAANLGFTDDSQIPSWAEEAIEELMFQGVISGNDDGSFAPARQLNRAEVAKIIVLATGVSCNTPGSSTFPDVQPGDWFFNYVECMADYGWINGYPDGMFRPAVGINRAEFAKMVVNAFDIEQDMSGAPHFGDVSASDWFYSYVETAYNAGIMQGYTASTFSPASPVTRAETVRVVYDAQLYVYDVVDVVSSTGALNLTLSGDTPAGTNIPFNATSVPYLTVNLSAAADGDVEVGRITFTRLGLGDNDDFDNCWVEFDGFKVGGEKSVSSDDTVEMTFNPPVIVPAGQTLVTDLVCSSDYGNTQNSGSNTSSLDDRNIGHRNRFAIIGPEDILSTALSVGGSFPVEGEEMETSDYAVSELEFEDLGSDTTIEVGDEFAEIGKFRLLNDSQSNKDIELRAITFENDGDGDLDELLFDTALYVGGDQVSYETIIDGDYITFRLDDGLTGGYILEDGDSRVYSMRSDIVAAENGDYLQFKVDNFEDIVGIEIGTSFGVRVVDEDGEDAEDQNATLHRYNIDAGELNISDKSPTSDEYAPGSNEVVFQIIRAVVGQPMEFDGLIFNVDNGSVTAGALTDTFDNFRLYVNDRLIDTEDSFQLVSGGNAATATDYFVEFDTNFELTTTSEIRLVGDVKNDAVNGDKIKFTVDSDNDFDNPEYISNGDQVPNTELLGQATSNFVEVQLSELVIRRTDGFSNNDFIVAGENNLNVMEFTLENNNSGDVNITGITMGAFGDGADSSAECQNYYIALFMGGVIQGDAQNLNSNCTADFNDLNNVVIASNDEIEFTVVVNTEEELAGTSSIPTTTVSSPSSSLDLALTINDGTNNINPAYVCVAGITSGDVQVGQLIRVYDSASNAGENGYIYDVQPNTSANTVLGSGTTFPAAFSTNPGAMFTCPVGSVAILVGTTDPGTSAETAITATTQFNFTNDHAIGQAMIDLGFAYVPSGSCAGAAGTALASPFTLYVNDASDFDLGEQVTITDLSATGGTCISSITTSTTGADVITIDDCATPGAGLVTTSATCDLSGATMMTLSGLPRVRFAVLDVEADNDENGTDVPVYEAGTPLMDQIADGVEATNGSWGENCELNNPAGGTSTIPVDNHLCGVFFSLIDTGQLSATSQGSVVKSKALVARDTDVDVMTIRFRAAYDDIYIEDLFLENDLYTTACTAMYGVSNAGYTAVGAGTTTDWGNSACQSDGTLATNEVANNLLADFSEFANRAEFKLVDSNGTILDTATMDASGKLNFKLDGSEIVVPRGSSEIVTVKVDLYDIDDDIATGQRLQLSLDVNNTATSSTNYGIEAESAATGNDLDVTTYSSTTFWEESDGAVTSDDFVVYRTVPMIEPTAYQNHGVAPNALHQEIGRFQISADAQSEVAIGRLTFDYSLNGIEVAGATGTVDASDFYVYEVIGGNVDTSTVILDGTVGSEILLTQLGNSDPSTAPTANNQFRTILNFVENSQYATTGLEVDNGQTRTFALYARQIADTSVPTDNTDDVINMAIARDDSFGGSYPLAVSSKLATGTELFEIVWSDVTETPRAGAADWHNGYLLDVNTNSTSIGN